MRPQSTILCPVDFTSASHAALAYATAIADHFGARLVLLAVDDPLLVESATIQGLTPSVTDLTDTELRRFAAGTLQAARGPRVTEYRTAVGKPGPEILRAAKELGAELIVMSSGERRGVRKLFFGSTTERVLRETTVPVLVTPDEPERLASLTELTRGIHHVMAPVDLSDASPHQVVVASALAQGLSVPLLIVHALEPIDAPAAVRITVPGLDAIRRAEADDRLTRLAASAKGKPELIVVAGDPSEEIAKLAQVRDVGLIVIGLHSPGILGPRMGTVTYRVLCLTRALVLALPPQPAAAAPR